MSVKSQMCEEFDRLCGLLHQTTRYTSRSQIFLRQISVSQSRGSMTYYSMSIATSFCRCCPTTKETSITDKTPAALISTNADMIWARNTGTLMCRLVSMRYSTGTDGIGFIRDDLSGTKRSKQKSGPSYLWVKGTLALITDRLVWDNIAA
jgi:hypothetical protein